MLYHTTTGYTIFYHDKYRNTNFGDGVNKTDENQDFQKGNTRNELMLLPNVSARVWQNFVAFSSVVNHQDFLNRGSCMRPATAVPGLHTAACRDRCGL